MDDLTLTELRRMLEAGELTARALTEHYLDRIEQVDRSGPAVNAVIEINPEALALAAERDAERRAGRRRGPLHGLPLLLKDNIDTRDRMRTTAGSLALVEAPPPARDAFLVRRLRALGAVILGKTNLSEWANFRGRHSVSGWSSRGGLTRNPYALDRTACGSSSGSAAAVAAGLAAAAIGTETDGSIICPSQTCGLVGLKPTLGLISRSGIIPIAHSQDTAGPMTRSVADAALLLGALTGVDPRDPATVLSRGRAPRDYTAALQRDGLRGARLGVARNLAGTDPRVLKLLAAAVEVLRELGATVIDPVAVPYGRRLGRDELEVLHVEFGADLNRYLAGRGPRSPVPDVAALIAFNEANRERVMPYFGQEHLLAAQAKGPLTDRRYRAARARNARQAGRLGLLAAMRRQRLDALVLPSGGPAWVIDLVNGDASNWDMESTSAAAVAGYPHLTVPAGFIAGLPVGLSFIGRPWQEAELLKFGYAFEQATHHRRPPQFLPTLPLEQK